jgi:transaldolase
VNNPLLRLHAYGQNIWLDSLSRHLIRSGGFKRLVDSDGLSGVTSNPSIFEKALAEGDAYDSDIQRLREKVPTAAEVFQALAIRDIQDAADILRPVFDRTGGIDGYVSIEVSPGFAHATDATIHEARSLWFAVERPNVMVKIPGTIAGIPAIERCIMDGLNINITLLFGLERYRQVTEAYLRGLEQRAEKGGDLHPVRSVASFFLSRIDVLIDPKLNDIGQRAGEKVQAAAKELQGRVAIASAKVAYQMYTEIFSSERFRKLEKLGARRQWLLWASTGTKNKEDSDVKYIEPLIGPETINTMPIETIDAYRDHGDPASRLDQGVDQSREVLRKLAAVGIDLDQMTRQLEDEGVAKFVKAFDTLIAQLERKLVPTSELTRR